MDVFFDIISKILQWVDCVSCPMQKAFMIGCAFSLHWFVERALELLEFSL